MREPRHTLYLVACAGMFVFGMVLALPGTVLALPDVVSRFELTLATRGLLISALFLGLLGGSFVPLGDGLFARVGEWTPNGAALSALLAAARGADDSVWGFGLFKLALMAVIFIGLALLVFPKARRA